jgi:hypothetical protein
MAKSSVRPQTVQSKEVFNLTDFTVVTDGQISGLWSTQLPHVN